MKFKAVIFPRPDLEGRWWHRMFKVIAVIGTVVLFFVFLRWANDAFKPYYAYSFESEFVKYPGKIKKFADVTKFYGDAHHLVAVFKHSGRPGAEQYVVDSERSGKDDYVIAERMEKDGLLANVTVKDLQNDFAPEYQKILLVLALTVFSYLLFVHVIYHLLAYIFAGRAQTAV